MVLVYSDDKNLTIELLNKGSELAKQMNKKLIAVNIGKDDFSKEYIAHGADQVLVVETDLDNFKAEEFTEILEKIIKETNSETILIGSNKNGKELAPRLAARFETGCITDCTNIYFKNNTLTA